MFEKIFRRLPGWLRPSIFVSGLGEVWDLWRASDARERGILLLVFAPMFVCVVGLLLSVASFVLFVLPSFVLRVLGWGLLVVLSGAGGRWCWERMAGKGAQARDADYEDVGPARERARDGR